MFCQKCGAQIPEGAHFCTNCGIMVELAVEPSPIAEEEISIEEHNVLSDREKEFLEKTRRLLLWEKKALRIQGTVFVIVYAICLGLFALLSFIALCTEPSEAFVMIVYSFIYALIYAHFIVIGIINLIAAKKIDFYLDTMNHSFHHTAKRCSSVGMIVFLVFFNCIALVFYLINFARINECASTIKSIIAKQK